MEIVTFKVTKAPQKLYFGMEASDKDISTCSNWYTVEGHIGLRSVSHLFNLSCWSTAGRLHLLASKIEKAHY